MRNRARHRRSIGWTCIILASTMLIAFVAGGFYLSQEKVAARQVQRSVHKAEKEVGHLITTVADFKQYEKNNIGIYAYLNDTLFYWNNNAVGPKLIKRKVPMNCDTICNLLTGDYYVKSFEKGPFECYAFKLLNTTYQLENKYFRNSFIANKLIFNNKIVFDNEKGFDILSNQGKLLGNAHIVRQKPSLTLNVQIFIIIEVLLLLIGLALLRKQRNKQKKGKYVFEKGLVIILILSIALTYIYYRLQTKRENQEMVEIANVLHEKRDVNFEESFENFTTLFLADSNLREMVFAESNVLNDVILGYCKELLFDDNMKEYTATLTLCEPQEELNIEPEGYTIDCDEYFRRILDENKQVRVGDNLFLMDYNTLDPNYFCKFRIVSEDSLQRKTLYFEFYKPIAPEGFGFPQLLKENNSQKPYDYSVANYRDNILVYKYGRYIYQNFLSSMKLRDKEITVVDSYKHYALFNNPNDALVISKPRKSWSENVAPFAIIFMALLAAYLIVYTLVRPRESRRWKDRSFGQRLQTVVLLTLVISFFAIGPVSVLYMQSLYNQKNAEKHFETTRTLCQEIGNDVDLKELIENGNRSVWTDLLHHYAATFFTDINLYGLDGRLMATTRQEVYELTLQAPIMNAKAYQNMARNKNLYFTHQEHLGKGVYESAYIPLIDDSGTTLAYLNTPYFSSSDDLHNEIKNFILTYINIILVLLGIALILILIITKHLTQPLALIQNKLGDLKIGQKNEPIEWKNNDEIGALVKQYNQLIVELEKSAAELKRTAAESAWRGVARQVAHEIKNSLTPMRLSVQLLQRNIDNGMASPEQIQRTTNTLIEQIDALSEIASSFSTYAKLPEMQPQPLDLAELVQNVVSLYDNAENIAFHYDYDKTKDHTYNGDKTHLNSAVSNIIKNATQAIGSKPDGRIDVTLKAEDDRFVISVKDNGKGIKEEDKDRIFLPNFTTKSGGSGVGLSLTYNIVQAAGGTISFESTEGEGATFVIELPKNLDWIII